MRGRRTRWLAATVILAALAAALLRPVGGTRVARAQTMDVPADVTATLPDGATVLSGASGDLLGTGETDWAVVYTLPDTSPTGMPIQTPHVAAVLPDGNGGWKVSATAAIPYAVAASVILADVAGTNGIVFTGGVGAHAQQMIILRWDGREFRKVFDQTDNTPNMALLDVNGNGLLEVVKQFSAYCEAYYTSPRLVEVWGWNGYQYVEDTGRYPTQIAAALAGIQSAFPRSVTEGWRADGVACLHGALAYLADKSGDQATADSECATALQIDPTFRAEWSPAACGAVGTAPSS